MFLDEYTGRGVLVAIVDSGVHASHPHVHHLAGGIAIRDDGTIDDDFVDRLGHGTAVAATILEKAPEVDLLPIKVFWRTLGTSVATLVQAIDAACARDAAIINLSLGTCDVQHREHLAAAVCRARARGAFVVSAMGDSNEAWLPGVFDDVIAAEPDWRCQHHEFHVVSRNGRRAIAASGYPRSIPGIPRERNLKGASFAVANATGFVARAIEASRAPTLPALFSRLEAAQALEQ